MTRWQGGWSWNRARTVIIIKKARGIGEVNSFDFYAMIILDSNCFYLNYVFAIRCSIEGNRLDDGRAVPEWRGSTP